MNSRISVFVAYAAIAMIGFGGTALLGFFGKSNDLTAVVAFLGFYGFFCTTATFYVIGKQKASIEALDSHISDVNDSHWKNSEEINRRIHETFAQIERDSQKQMDSVWMNIDRLESDIEDCRSCTPCKK